MKYKEIETAIRILEDLIYELETFCNDICHSDTCYDCNIPYVIDKLTEVVSLLGEI